MFRLDLLDNDNAVRGALLPTVNHMQTARRIARDTALENGERILIVRDSGPGKDRPVLLVLPDGSFCAPPTAKTDCTRLANPGLPCWCPACRAGRRA